MIPSSTVWRVGKETSVLGGYTLANYLELATILFRFPSYNKYQKNYQPPAFICHPLLQTKINWVVYL